jgi:hypothetical protein
MGANSNSGRAGTGGAANSTSSGGGTGNSAVDAQDRAVDARVKSICKGC